MSSGMFRAIIEHLLYEGSCAHDDVYEGHYHGGAECEWEKAEDLVRRLGVLDERPRPVDEPPACPWCGARESKRSEKFVGYTCGTRLGVVNKYANRSLECRVGFYE